MKISLETVEMTDEQRTQLANVIDEKVSKRRANRNEARDFVWQHGADWAEVLTDQHRELTEPAADEPVDEDDEDGDEPDLDDLL